MPAENVTVTANATAGTDTPYRVQHWQQNVDGGDDHTETNYTLADTDDLTATTDTSITPEVKTYTGFTSPETVTVNVDGDGSLVVNYYYTRNSYTVSLSAGTGIASVTGAGTYRLGQEIELNAELTTKPPYQFVGWRGTDSFESEEIHRTITMPAYDISLLAEGALVKCVSFSAVCAERVEVGSSFNVRELSVVASYSNGDTIEITGNTGLAFVDKNGKLTTDVKESAAGRQSYTILYEFNGFKTYSTVDIVFEDTLAPVISDVKFNDNWTKTLDITFKVRDNSSGPLNYLLAYNEEYTLDELNAEIFQKTTLGELKVTIRSNGTYILYVVDPSGNMSQKAFTVSCIDDIAPEMDIWLCFVDNKGKTKRILSEEQVPGDAQYITFEIEAVDNETTVEKYRYKADGKSWSEWQTGNTFAGLYLNGNYTFEAMDACGNVSSKTITLTMLSQKFAVHYQDVDQNGNILKETIEEKLLGSSVSGAELGTITTTGAYYEGYDYISCDTSVVETSGAIVHRYFKLHEFTVTYMDADSNILKTDKVLYGKVSTYGQDMSKPGYQTDAGSYSYIFKGWGNRNGDLIDTTAVKEDLTLYPIYETLFFAAVQPEDILYFEEDNSPTGYLPDLDSLDLTMIGSSPKYIEQSYEKKPANSTENPLQENPLVMSQSPEKKKTFTKILSSMETQKGQTVIKTTAAVAGTTMGLTVVSLLMQLLSGTGLVQSIIFGYVLLRKKIRYVQGAWMVSEEGMKYVDKFGRKLEVESHGKQLVFKRKNKVYRAINTEELAEKLRTGRITYAQFENTVSKSEVYTVFSKDVGIEVYNVKAQSGRIKKKMRGFNLSSNIRSMMKGIGEYSVRINNSGKQILFDVKYAMDNV